MPMLILRLHHPKDGTIEIQQQQRVVVVEEIRHDMTMTITTTTVILEAADVPHHGEIIVRHGPDHATVVGPTKAVAIARGIDRTVVTGPILGHHRIIVIGIEIGVIGKVVVDGRTADHDRAIVGAAVGRDAGAENALIGIIIIIVITTTIIIEMVEDIIVVDHGRDLEVVAVVDEDRRGEVGVILGNVPELPKGEGIIHNVVVVVREAKREELNDVVVEVEVVAGEDRIIHDRMIDTVHPAVVEDHHGVLSLVPTIDIVPLLVVVVATPREEDVIIEEVVVVVTITMVAVEGVITIILPTIIMAMEAARRRRNAVVGTGIEIVGTTTTIIIMAITITTVAIIMVQGMVVVLTTNVVEEERRMPDTKEEEVRRKGKGTDLTMQPKIGRKAI